MRPAASSPLTPHSSSYNQLLGYLKMLSVTLIPSSDLALGDALGASATFAVQKAASRHQFPHEAVVAVKTPRENIHRSPYILRYLLNEILNEVRVMTHLDRNPRGNPSRYRAREERQRGIPPKTSRGAGRRLPWLVPAPIPPTMVLEAQVLYGNSRWSRGVIYDPDRPLRRQGGRHLIFLSNTHRNVD